jgi:hypothetical protein
LCIKVNQVILDVPYKRVILLSPNEKPFWFQVKPFLVPGRTIMGSMLWKGFYMEPQTVLLGTKRVLSGTNKGSSKGSRVGTAKEPF